MKNGFFSAVYRLDKFLGKYKGPVAVVGIVIVALFVGVVATAHQAGRARLEKGHSFLEQAGRRGDTRMIASWTLTDPRAQYRPAVRMEALQLERLRATVKAAARSPHYRSLQGFEVSSLADLARLPITTKEEARSASPWGLLAVPREELFQYHETFGTTGTP